MGRPPRAETSATVLTTIRWTVAEHAALVRLARRNGETISALVRRTVRDRQRELDLLPRPTKEAP